MHCRRLVLLAAVALVAAAATTAHAAKITLSSKTLFAMKSSADAMPAQLAFDSFTSASAVTLDGRLADTGQAWDVTLGTLQVTGGRLRCTTCSGGNYGAAMLDADMAQVTASVDLRQMSAGTTGNAGLVMNANATGTQGIVIWWGAGVIRIFRYTGGGLAQLAQANTGNLSTTADVPLVATYSAGKYTVSFNGTVTLVYTLSAADQTTFGANTQFGVVINDDPDRIRLDDFEVKR